MATIVTARPKVNRSKVNQPKINQPKTGQSKDATMNLVRHVQLINEALSRARMRQPQTANSEAIRPARQIMMSSRRREQDRLLGL